MQRINHSVFDMHYHLVLVVKYRRNVLDDAISQFLKVTRGLWKSHFWKAGFYISITGGANLETIKKYVREQRG